MPQVLLEGTNSTLRLEHYKNSGYNQFEANKTIEYWLKWSSTKPWLNISEFYFKLDFRTSTIFFSVPEKLSSHKTFSGDETSGKEGRTRNNSCAPSQFSN